MLSPAQIALLHEVSNHARNANAIGPYAVRPRSRRTAQVLIREHFVKAVHNYVIHKNGVVEIPNAPDDMFVSLYY